MKKIIAFLKKYQIVVMLVLVAIFMISYRVLGSRQTETETETAPTPTPTTALQPQGEGRGISEKVFVEKLLEQYPLTPHLPYLGKDFSIIYTNDLALDIILDIPDTAANRQKVLDWIRDQGVDPQTHNISWKEREY